MLCLLYFTLVLFIWFSINCYFSSVFYLRILVNSYWDFIMNSWVWKWQSLVVIHLLCSEQLVDAEELSSVQFSRSVVSDSLRPLESQHARPPCPSPTSGVHSDSRPSSQWCHPAISSSVVPFSSCPQSLQHQSLFQWVNSSHEVARVLEFRL